LRLAVAPGSQALIAGFIGAGGAVDGVFALIDEVPPKPHTRRPESGAGTAADGIP
jgi:hypothetical protein